MLIVTITNVALLLLAALQRLHRGPWNFKCLHVYGCCVSVNITMAVHACGSCVFPICMTVCVSLCDYIKRIFENQRDQIALRNVVRKYPPPQQPTL